jgi:excinuclease ABC subunit B
VGGWNTPTAHSSFSINNSGIIVRTLFGDIMEKPFRLVNEFIPKGDQPQAIVKLSDGVTLGHDYQTLLGVTGSGKTFTMANIVSQVQRPTLVMAHNKTLAAQLAAEFREFFPHNAVEYFVSYYDYYQPEAYLPRTDTYIEKESQINEEIEKLRNSATRSLLTRRDVLIVASVSAIYGLGDPSDYQEMTVKITKGEQFKREKLLRRLADLQYERNDVNFTRGKFRVRGENIEVIPSYEDRAIRVELFGDTVERIVELDALTGEILGVMEEAIIFPAKHYVTPQDKLHGALAEIESDLEKEVKAFKGRNKLIEAQRLEQRVKYDLEMIREVGFCNSIENYSRYFDGREPGSAPSSLLDYFPDDFLLFVDESHITMPQIRGMYFGDKARKDVLVEYGFRMAAAKDNRPLKFDEFLRRINQTIFVSATPADYEIQQSKQVVEQLIRPTGLLDPLVEVRPTDGQIDDLHFEIEKRVKKKQRVLVTTLTKRMAEDLSEYLAEAGVRVHYLHSDVETLDRIDILRDLRLGVYDVVVGINLLREGLDLPEVSLVAILDADKEGFLRGKTALIQTMGRAARHQEGQVIMYANKMTDSMRVAIEETQRRRAVQEEYNRVHNITPASIIKAIKDQLPHERVDEQAGQLSEDVLQQLTFDIPKDELKRMVKKLEEEMRMAAENLDFEYAAQLRDKLTEARQNM